MTNPSVNRDVLIFLHVPKTAGTTLNRLIETQYNPMRIYSIPGGWGSRRATLKLRRMPAHRLNRIQVVKGHMEFGMHRYLPNPASYMTILREPVDRVISSYFYALSHRFHPLHRIVSTQQVTLSQFLDLAPWVHNLQTKLIGGIPLVEVNPPHSLAAARRGEVVPWEQFAGRHCDENVLVAARINLDSHFSMIGLTERFTESLALLQIVYGWEFSNVQNFRKSSKRPTETRFSEKVLERIAQLNAFDLDLYRVGQSLFQSRLDQHGEEIEEILAGLKNIKNPHPLVARCRAGLAWSRFAVSLTRSVI